MALDYAGQKSKWLPYGWDAVPASVSQCLQSQSQPQSHAPVPINATNPRCVPELPHKQTNSEVLASLGFTPEVLSTFKIRWNTLVQYVSGFAVHHVNVVCFSVAFVTKYDRSADNCRAVTTTMWAHSFERTSSPVSASKSATLRRLRCL